MESKTRHECYICGRLFDAFGKPEICNKCLNAPHKHRPRSDDRADKREPSDTFIEAWDDYTGEYE